MLNTQDKTTILKRSIEITIAYAGSANASPSRVAPLLKEVYEQLKELNEDAKSK